MSKVSIKVDLEEIKRAVDKVFPPAMVKQLINYF